MVRIRRLVRRFISIGVLSMLPVLISACATTAVTPTPAATPKVIGPNLTPVITPSPANPPMTVVITAPSPTPSPAALKSPTPMPTPLFSPTPAPKPVPSAATPLEQALASGKPTLAEFGRDICGPCKEMKPIIEALAGEYKGRANVVSINIDNYKDLANKHKVMSIPTQVFFDSSGKEVARHMGFYPKEEIVVQLKKMGV